MMSGQAPCLQRIDQSLRERRNDVTAKKRNDTATITAMATSQWAASRVHARNGGIEPRKRQHRKNRAGDLVKKLLQGAPEAAESRRARCADVWKACSRGHARILA